MEDLSSRLENMAVDATVSKETLSELLKAMAEQSRSYISISDMISFVSFSKRRQQDVIEVDQGLSSSFANVSVNSGLTSAEASSSSSSSNATFTFKTPKKEAPEQQQPEEGGPFSFGSPFSGTSASSSSSAPPVFGDIAAVASDSKSSAFPESPVSFLNTSSASTIPSTTSVETTETKENMNNYSNAHARKGGRSSRRNKSSNSKSSSNDSSFAIDLDLDMTASLPAGSSSAFGVDVSAPVGGGSSNEASASVPASTGGLAGWFWGPKPNTAEANPIDEDSEKQSIEGNKPTKQQKVGSARNFFGSSSGEGADTTASASASNQYLYGKGIDPLQPDGGEKDTFGSTKSGTASTDGTSTTNSGSAGNTSKGFWSSARASPGSGMDITENSLDSSDEDDDDDSRNVKDNDMFRDIAAKAAQNEFDQAVNDALKNIPPVPGSSTGVSGQSTVASSVVESDTETVDTFTPEDVDNLSDADEKSVLSDSEESIPPFSDDDINVDGLMSDDTDAPPLPPPSSTDYSGFNPPPPPSSSSSGADEGLDFSGQFSADNFSFEDLVWGATTGTRSEGRSAGERQQSAAAREARRKARRGSPTKKGSRSKAAGNDVNDADAPPAWWKEADPLGTSMETDQSDLPQSSAPDRLPDHTSIEKANHWRMAGKDYYSNNKYEDALHAYIQALHYAPVNWPTRAIILGNRAATYMMLQRFIEAASDCEASLLADASMVKLHVRRARCMLRLGMFSAVDDICARVLEMPPPSANTIILSPDQDVSVAKSDAKKTLKDLATARQLTQHLTSNESILDFEGVLSISESLTDLCPQFKMAHTSKVKALNKLQRWDEAKTFAEKITYNAHVSIQRLTAHPKAMLPSPEPDLLHWKLSSAKSSNPLRTVQNVLKANSDKIVHMIMSMDSELASSYLTALKNVKVSHQCCADVMLKISNILEKMCTICDDPSRPFATNGSATDSAVRQQWGWVFREKERMALLLDQKNSADTYFKSSRFQEATIKYAGALKADPSAIRWNAILHSNRAAAYMALNMCEDAIRDCHQSINKDPNYTRAYIRRARAFRSLSDFNASVRDYRKYLSSTPTPTDYKDVNEELQDTLAAAARKTQEDQRRHQRERAEEQHQQEKRDEQFSARNQRGARSNGFPHSGNGSTRPGGYSFRQDSSGSDNYSGRFNSKSRTGSGPNTRQKPFSFYDDSDEEPMFGERKNPFSGAGTGRGYSHSSGYKPQPGPSSSRSRGRKVPPVDSDGEELPDHYKTLGVNTSSTEAEIRKAYHKAALKFHPDKNKDPGAEEIFKGINDAYGTLQDKSARATYDRKMR